MNDIALPQTLTSQAPRWHLRLLGAVELLDEHNRPTRLPTRAATLLLTRLALAPQRQHPREELVELLWPGVDAQTGRNRLRQALSVLRTLLQPPGGPQRPVLLADRRSVTLVAGALRSDVQSFLHALSQGHTQRARASYQGELLPGHFDEWVLEERRHLAARAEVLAGLHDAALVPDAAPAPAAPDIEHRLPRYLTRLVGFEADGRWPRSWPSSAWWCCAALAAPAKRAWRWKWHAPWRSVPTAAWATRALTT